MLLILAVLALIAAIGGFFYVGLASQQSRRIQLASIGLFGLGLLIIGLSVTNPSWYARG
jgi:hypothetical protein